MKNKKSHIIILLFILIISCKKETKLNKNKVFVNTKLKTERIDTLKKVKEKIVLKRKLKKQILIDTLIIQKDTLFIKEKSFLSKKKTYAKCKGKLNEVNVYFIAKTNSNSDYTYCIGTNPKKNEKNENNLTIVLLKSNKIIYELNIKEFISPNYTMFLKICDDTKVNKIDEIDEIICFSYGQEFCGGNNGEYLFFRKNGKLIKGVSIGGYGEPGTEYFEQNVILPNNKVHNQIWVENKVGKDDLVYFTYLEKYEFINDSLLMLNPKSKNIYFVTAKNGLTQRSEPSVNGKSLGKLPYKAKVNVLNKTKIEMTLNEEKKKISGHWVQIEYKGKQPYDNSFFIFDGYLSKSEPAD